MSIPQPFHRVIQPRGVRRRLGAALLAVTATPLSLAVGAAVAVGVAAPASAETVATPGSGTFTIDGHGNGHGHGLSQYGARGAARAGLGAAAIVGFYYADTALVTAAPSTIRVAITDGNGDAEVGSAAGMYLSWSGGAVALPTAGIVRWRLLAGEGGSLTAQYATTTAWVTWMSGLPSLAYFSASGGTVRLYAGSYATDYRGQVGATTTGGFTVLNRLDLDAYTQGVLPREMPSGWETEAVRAQAIAARTYARYELDHNAARPYDICDSDSCQVYGGMARYVGGSYAYGETDATNAAVASTVNQIITYGGAAVFAQFSADDGGWTTAGGQPYLIARPDPYEAGSGSPWLNWTRTATASSVAGRVGLASVSSIAVLQRDGNGDWGGRVLTARFSGTDAQGRAAAVTTSGSAAASALGLPHEWFQVRSTGVTGALDGTATYGRFGLRIEGWAADPDHLDRSTQVAVYVANGGGQTVTASLYRPDVAAYLGSSYADFGYSVVAWLPPAGGTACVYAIDIDGAANLLLGCVSATPPSNPIGNAETWGTDGHGHPTIGGWGFDWDGDGGSTVVRAYYGSSAVDTVANGSRPDVQSYFGLQNAAEGFSLTLPAGDNHVCVWVMNTVGPGDSASIACRYFVGGVWS